MGGIGGMEPGPMLVLKLRGAGIPLTVRFLGTGVRPAVETEGRRACGETCGVFGVEIASWSLPSSIRHIPAMFGSWLFPWLLRDDRGRRLSVIEFVE